MKVIIKETAAEASAAVADVFLQQVKIKADSVLGLATGGTPLAIYARLRSEYEKGNGCYRSVTTFNLDEYLGLNAAHAASYAHYMSENLFSHIDIDPARAHIPDGSASDASLEAERYEALIAAAGGIDLMLLGLGRNAHIGFNEPGSSHSSRTRCVDLTTSTLEANAGYFAPGVRQPTQAITMGIGTILECRRIVVLATGFEKAEAVAASIDGPASEDVPGSALAGHADVTFVLDRAAAKNLARVRPLERRA